MPQKAISIYISTVLHAWWPCAPTTCNNFLFTIPSLFSHKKFKFTKFI